MLVVSFSIAVDENRAEEARGILVNDFGVEVVKEVKYTERLCFAEPATRVYFECFAPLNRIEALTDYLDRVFTGTAILSY